jgi:aspartate aminotransferase
MSNEFLAIYPPNRLHMRAMPKLLKYTADVKLYSESQKIIEETLKELNIEYVPPEGTFFLFPKIPYDIDEMSFCKAMVENFIVIVPGSAFGKKGFYRLSFCKGPEDIKRGMEQFKIAYKKVIKELTQKKNENQEKYEMEEKQFSERKDSSNKKPIHN